MFYIYFIYAVYPLAADKKLVVIMGCLLVMLQCNNEMYRIDFVDVGIFDI